MQRENQAWLEDLRANGEQQQRALSDLRDILLRILPNALARWLSPGSGHFDAFLEDVVQETLLRVLDRLDTFAGRSKFTTWVYTIAIRIAMNELRLRKWREVSLDFLEEGQQPESMPSERFAAAVVNPEAALEQKDAMQLLQQYIDQELSPRQRSVMMAVNVQGLPMDVVAERMNSNRNAIYKMMHDARLKLKRRLEREGLPPQELLKMFGNQD
jgi:RNA polymerase sigma-70 factor (ECF subfamily)